MFASLALALGLSNYTHIQSQLIAEVRDAYMAHLLYLDDT